MEKNVIPWSHQPKGLNARSQKGGDTVRKLDSQLWRKPHSHGTLAALRPAPVLTIPESATVMSVCELWAARRIGCVLIVGDDGSVIGIITCQDLAFRVTADGLDPRSTYVRNIMTPNPVVAAESTGMVQSLEIMLSNRIKHLPVMSDDGKIAGVVDLMKIFNEILSQAQRKSTAAEQLFKAMVGVEAKFDTNQSNPDLLAWVKSLREKTALPNLQSITNPQAQPLVVNPELSVRKAAHLMRNQGSTIVCIIYNTSSTFRAPRISGILTPVDIVLRVLALGLDATACGVGTVMTPQPDTALLTMSMYDAVKMMFNGMYLHLPIIEEDGSLVTVFDALTLLEASTEQIKGANQDITIPVAAGGPIWDRFADYATGKPPRRRTHQRLPDVVPVIDSSQHKLNSGEHSDVVQGFSEHSSKSAANSVTLSFPIRALENDSAERSLEFDGPDPSLSSSGHPVAPGPPGENATLTPLPGYQPKIAGDDQSPESPPISLPLQLNSPARNGISQPGMSALVDQLSEILRNVGQYKRLLRCHEADAQRLLDVFQMVLDMPEIGSEFRGQLIVATQRLSRRVGLYPTCYDLKDIESAGEHPVAYGSFADIYKGRFLGQNVCLKVIRLYQTSHVDSFLKQFSAEAILWGQLLHQNLLPIYGLYRYNTRLCLVSPWMEHGDVSAFLKRHPDANRMLLVSDIVSGLIYLHDHNIVHGDIKGVNILVDGSHRACLADFGLSAITDTEILHWTSHSSAASKGGSIRWQAPELFNVEDDHVVHNSKPSDIYALACVMYEIFTGNLPFFELVRDSVIMLRVKEGAQPSRPPASSISWRAWGLTESLWSLMESCWNVDPHSRPSANSVSESLLLNHIVDDRPAADSDVLSPPRFRNSQSGQYEASSVSDIIKVLDSLVQ